MVPFIPFNGAWLQIDRTLCGRDSGSISESRFIFEVRREYLLLCAEVDFRIYCDGSFSKCSEIEPLTLDLTGCQTPVGVPLEVRFFEKHGKS